MNLGGVILCGGRSSRMGTDKALLRFAGKTLLESVIEQVRLGIGEGPIVVVAAPQQQLPDLFGVEVIRDEETHPGPLAGLVKAFSSWQSPEEWAFVTGCDAPGLVPGLIAYLKTQLGVLPKAEVVLPVVGGYEQPLVACYQIKKCLAKLGSMDTRNGSLRSFTAKLTRYEVEESEIRKRDLQLESFWNCHDPLDWEKWQARKQNLMAGAVVVSRGNSQT